MIIKGLLYQLVRKTIIIFGTIAAMLLVNYYFLSSFPEGM